MMAGVITFFVEAADKKNIRKAAKSQGLDMASFSRMLVLKETKKWLEDQKR